MPRKKLLVDSCCYFRLAQTIHPLLGEEFGGIQKYILYLIEEFEREYMKSSRLRGKFGWVRQSEYLENRRRNRIRTTAKEKLEIENVFQHMSGFSIDEGLTTSPEDIKGVATAYVCSIPIVSDDKDLMVLAEAFDVKCLKTLDLLALMKREQHVKVDVVKQIVGYWAAIPDVPRDCEEDCERLFKIDFKKISAAYK